MTATEFDPIARRIGRLWPPPMPAVIVEEYHAVLEGFAASQVSRAIDLIARQRREFKPDVGLIWETANVQPGTQLALPAGVVDPVNAEEHAEIMTDAHRRMTAEHRRRHAIVIDILHTTGRRIPLPELSSLMAMSACCAEDFDRRVAEWRQA